MQRLAWICVGTLLASPASALASPPPPVAATVESTLATGSRQIRQFAFDGNPATYFQSEKSPSKGDHFTLKFDAPVELKSLSVATGKPDGAEKLEAGSVEASADGATFEPLAKFADGSASFKPGDKGRKVKALRITPAEGAKSPLVIREVSIESEPAVATFRYPVEFVLDVADAPDLKEWTEKVARECERYYPAINDELASDGYKPPTVIRMELKSDYKGVAQAGGTQITGSVDYFKSHPKDVGAMIHETVHVVQRYRGRGNPSWLVEGVADYVRFFKYEPGTAGRLDPKRARYNASYRVSAAFLDYLCKTYDKEIVRKLNQAMREGKYKEEIFQDLTGKPLADLNKDWLATLKK